ncbi:unnamed protein product [Haemonchus placei]|uniref:G_PROTEIN_RECEP_F1_2 domain-containing protein n=1 Tax=Haemonchus placei TaxID=6290 RepID=A0A0N4WVN0_HAEPC|nr:unnamed protein product [Haemonchus placei]
MESFRLALIIELILLLSLIAFVNVFCAIKIKFYLKNTKQTSCWLLQYHFFQAACPIVFLVTPYCFAVFLLFTGIDSNQIITVVLSTLLALYPIFNPIIIITFMKEYRNFIAIKLKAPDVVREIDKPI